MKNVSLILIHLLVVVAKLLGPGGIKGIIAENLLLKQQLLVVCRPRQRAPNLLPADRFLFGFFSLFLRPGRIVKTAVGIRPSTLLRFHDYMVRRKYRALYSPHHRGKPGPKGGTCAVAIIPAKPDAYPADAEAGSAQMLPRVHFIGTFYSISSASENNYHLRTTAPTVRHQAIF